MKQQYIEKRFKRASINLLGIIEEIVDHYESLGLVLTARQLYYQLVARDVIPNNMKAYKQVTCLLNDAKLAGLLDWDMFEDRTRTVESLRHFSSGKDALRFAGQTFHMDMWDNQPCRVICIVEKEALFGVLWQACSKYDVPLLAARGYPSSTVLRDMCVNRISPYDYQEHHILHLGDHDPSGIDMTRDLSERISLFSEPNITVTRLALNFDQVKKLKPPENPAKMTDSRANGYVKRFGRSSWELDAIEPVAMEKLLSDAISNLIDDERWEEREQEISGIKDKITTIARNFKE